MMQYLEDLFHNKLTQDGCLQQLLEVEAELTEDADCEQAEDCSGCPKGVPNTSRHCEVRCNASSCIGQAAR